MKRWMSGVTFHGLRPQFWYLYARRPSFAEGLVDVPALAWGWMVPPALECLQALCDLRPRPALRVTEDDTETLVREVHGVWVLHL